MNTMSVGWSWTFGPRRLRDDERFLGLSIQGRALLLGLYWIADTAGIGPAGPLALANKLGLRADFQQNIEPLLRDLETSGFIELYPYAKMRYWRLIDYHKDAPAAFMRLHRRGTYPYRDGVVLAAARAKVSEESRCLPDRRQQPTGGWYWWWVPSVRLLSDAGFLQLDTLERFVLMSLYTVCDTHGRGPMNAQAMQRLLAAWEVEIDFGSCFSLLIQRGLLSAYEVNGNGYWELVGYDADAPPDYTRKRAAGTFPGLDGVVPPSPRREPPANPLPLSRRCLDGVVTASPQRAEIDSTVSPLDETESESKNERKIVQVSGIVGGRTRIREHAYDARADLPYSELSPQQTPNPSGHVACDARRDPERRAAVSTDSTQGAAEGAWPSERCEASASRWLNRLAKEASGATADIVCLQSLAFEDPEAFVDACTKMVTQPDRWKQDAVRSLRNKCRHATATRRRISGVGPDESSGGGGSDYSTERDQEQFGSVQEPSVTWPNPHCESYGEAWLRQQETVRRKGGRNRWAVSVKRSDLMAIAHEFPMYFAEAASKMCEGKLGWGNRDAARWLRGECEFLREKYEDSRARLGLTPR